MLANSYKNTPSTVLLKMKYGLIAVATLWTAACPPAWAINKCTGPDGRFTFQDAPCTSQGEKVQVRPASGHAPMMSAPVLSGAGVIIKKPTEAERLNALTEASQRERRKNDLDERLVPYARAAIDYQQAECDGQLKALQSKKRAANNNLAGATWEGSISSEMTAIATRCDTRSRNLREELDALRKECWALGGCKVG